MVKKYKTYKIYQTIIFTNSIKSFPQYKKHGIKMLRKSQKVKPWHVLPHGPLNSDNIEFSNTFG